MIKAFGSYPPMGQYYSLSAAPEPTGTKKMIEWFKAQPVNAQVGFAVAAGGALILGIWGISSLISPAPDYKKNFRQAGFKLGARRAKKTDGKIITVKGGRRFGHTKPPKKYRRMGARKKSDYAWSDGYKYPLIFRTTSGKVKAKETRSHIANAKSKFTKNKHLYPMHVRRKIAKRINAASKKYNVGPTKVKP